MADKSQLTTVGGQAVTTFSTSGAADLALLTAPGRLCSVAVLTGGITLLNFYDSSTTSGAATAKHVWTMTRTTTGLTGKVYDLQIPLQYGLVVGRSADAPGCLVTYNADSAYGR